MDENFPTGRRMISIPLQPATKIGRQQGDERRHKPLPSTPILCKSCYSIFPDLRRLLRVYCSSFSKCMLFLNEICDWQRILPSDPTTSETYRARALNRINFTSLKESAGRQQNMMEKEEEDDEFFETIDKLIAQGINAGDLKKLQDAGIYTCNGLMMNTKKALSNIKGLSDAKVDKICEAAERIVQIGFCTGSELLNRRKQVVRITTGSQALDLLLGGGVETMAITEAFGEFRTGKTQIAHTLCVSTQLPLSMGGGNGKVAYIDTEGTFRPDRLGPIAERFGLDYAAVLDNIMYARAYTHEHQFNLLGGLASRMAEEPFRLVIIDSIMALFRVDFTGRGELADRQQKLAQMLSKLIKIAEEFNVAVFMTNHVIADPGGGTFVADPKKPAGGHVIAHASTIRLMLRKGKAEQRICKVFDSPSLPDDEAITRGGIADIKD